MLLSKYRRFSFTLRPFSSNSTDEVLFEVKNNIGIITLNRPKSLNALTVSMSALINSKLKEWENERSFVILRASSDRSFCAGGDIVAITSDKFEGRSLFRNQYDSNYTVKNYKIPFVSLYTGIVMGAGVGLSIHGTYRVATENTIFAMPETRIGLLTESTGSYFLPRMQGKLGLFLGLTGHRLKGVDVVKTGIATHFLPSDKVQDLFDELMKANANSIDDVLNKTTIDVGKEQFSLNPQLDLINSCFDGDSVEKIFELLQKDGSAWSKNVKDILSNASPTSLKVSKRVIDFGATKDLHECIITEFRLVWNALEKTISPDLYEGVRAVLLDKDNNPKWSPSSLNEVADENVDKICFTVLPPGEELDI